jgi:universal stress protein E
VPLLLVRSAAPYSKPRVLAAVDPGGHGLRVSSLDAGIVGMAAVVATATDGGVSVVHCVREPPLALAVRPAALRQERRRVATLLRHLSRGAGIPAREARVVDGNPVGQLLEAVSKDDIDILVLGTVVRGPIRQALIGSTTEQLLHAAPCDMLLVKPNASRLVTRRAAKARR